jgi:hypothetical protein
MGMLGMLRRIALQIFLDNAPGMFRLRFQHKNFYAVSSFGRLTQGKRIRRDRSGRTNPRTLEQAANDHSLSSRSGRVRYDDALSRVMFRHGNFTASTIARFRPKVHTKCGGIHRPMMEDGRALGPTQEEIDEESRRIRRLRILVHLTIESIAGGDLTPEEAAGMVAATRRVALEMFPGKERAFDLIYRPKFQRVMNAVYRLQ